MKAIGHGEFKNHIGEKCKIIALGGMHFTGTIISHDSVQLSPGGLYGDIKLSFREANVSIDEN